MCCLMLMTTTDHTNGKLPSIVLMLHRGSSSSSCSAESESKVFLGALDACVGLDMAIVDRPR